MTGLLLVGCSSANGVDRAARPNTPSATPTTVPTPSNSRSPAACRSPAFRQHEFGLRVDGVRRRYLLSVAAGSAPRPLVILLHGFDSTAAGIDRYTQLPRAGVAAGFAVATPSGYDERWNFPRRRSIGPDDVLFIRQLIRAVAHQTCLDPKGVFVTGFSDGADMADTLACAVPVVRAVAGVAASVPVHNCSHPLDVLQIHGDADPVVPYSGGGGDRPAPFQGEEAVSVATQMSAWRTLDGCKRQVRSSTLRGGVEESRSVGCAGGRQVVLLDVHGGGHTWPGASIDLPYGATNHAMSATRRILYFFEQSMNG